VKAVDANIFTKQADKFKQTWSTCQKVDGNCFLGQEKSADGRVHATRDNNDVRNVLRTTNYVEPFRTNGRNADIQCSAPS
jgi:hypothetical protein